MSSPLRAATSYGVRPVLLIHEAMRSSAVAPSALARMAKWGEGYIGASVPAAMVAEAFDGARAAWKEAGRGGSPRLVAICYFALGDGEAGVANAGDYYSVSPSFESAGCSSMKLVLSAAIGSGVDHAPKSEAASDGALSAAGGERYRYPWALRLVS